MKAFLLSHSGVTRPDELFSTLSTTRAIATWVSPFPYGAIILSELTVNDLTAVLDTHLVGTWFILTELSPTSCNGRLPEQFWRYVQNPAQAQSDQVLAQIEKSSRRSIPPSPSASSIREIIEGLASHHGRRAS